MPKLTRKSTATAKNRGMSVSLHVVSREGEWQIIAEGRKTATSVHPTQTEAARHARSIAKKQSTEVVIHGRNGRIRERESYSRDPLPQKRARKVLAPVGRPRTVSRRAISKAVTEAIRESISVSES